MHKEEYPASHSTNCWVRASALASKDEWVALPSSIAAASVDMSSCAPLWTLSSPTACVSRRNPVSGQRRRSPASDVFHRAIKSGFQNTQ
jgi:hypothetical protein